VKEFRNPESNRSPGAVLADLVVAVGCLLVGAYVDGALGGGAGFSVGSVGFVAYLFLSGRAFRRLGLRRLFVADP
jgi:hypothetical protein